MSSCRGAINRVSRWPRSPRRCGERARRHDDEARDGKLDDGIANFRAILVNRPELVRVRLELARAFFLKEEDTLARRHFEHVLAGDPPEAVKTNIDRFLGVMRARRRWDAWFGAAVAPDSNLNTASGNRTIFLDTPFGRLPFTLDGDISARSGIGISAWAGGEYQYPLGSGWRLRSGAGASMREYKGRDFDRQSAHAHIGPRRLLGPHTEASLLAVMQRQWAAGQPDTDESGFRLEGRHRITPRLTLDGRMGARRRKARGRDWLDGPVGEIDAGLSWVALPTLRLSARAGHHWSRAKCEHWRSRGPNASLDATLALPAGFTLGARAAMHWTDYQGSGLAHRTIDGEPREDRAHRRSRSRSTTAPSPCWDSAPASRWSTNSARPTPRPSTTSATAWNSPSCGCSERSGAHFMAPCSDGHAMAAVVDPDTKFHDAVAGESGVTERPPRRRSPQYPLHEQCISQGRHMTVRRRSCVGKARSFQIDGGSKFQVEASEGSSTIRIVFALAVRSLRRPSAVRPARRPALPSRRPALAAGRRGPRRPIPAGYALGRHATRDERA